MIFNYVCTSLRVLLRRLFLKMCSWWWNTMIQIHVLFCASKNAKFYIHDLHKNFLFLFTYVFESALYEIIKILWHEYLQCEIETSCDWCIYKNYLKKWTKCCYVVLSWSHVIFKNLSKFSIWINLMQRHYWHDSFVFAENWLTMSKKKSANSKNFKRVHRVIIRNWDFVNITSYCSMFTRFCIRRYKFVHDDFLNFCWFLSLRLIKFSKSKLIDKE